MTATRFFGDVPSFRIFDPSMRPSDFEPFGVAMCAAAMELCCCGTQGQQNRTHAISSTDSAIEFALFGHFFILLVFLNDGTP